MGEIKPNTIEQGLVMLLTDAMLPLFEQFHKSIFEQHPDKLLTKQEAADLLGVTTETISNYIARHKIKPYYYGTEKSPLFRHGDLLIIKNQKKK